jgi:hypothetical protein
MDHITIDTVNLWARKKRQQGLSWVTIKNILRTMQRVVSCASKDQKSPFLLRGLQIPQKDRLHMQIRSRQAVSFSWDEAKRIARAIQKLDSLDETRKKTYSMAVLFGAATAFDAANYSR